MPPKKRAVLGRSKQADKVIGALLLPANGQRPPFIPRGAIAAAVNKSRYSLPADRKATASQQPCEVEVVSRYKYEGLNNKRDPRKRQEERTGPSLRAQKMQQIGAARRSAQALAKGGNK